MKARLKVLTGGSAGKELKLKEGQFLIGRSDSCHLRPRSDAISRKHCVLFIDDKSVRVRDLKSRNGTLVNGEKTEGDVKLKSGDKLVVGPLEFEVVITADAPESSPQPATPQPAPQAAPETSAPKQPAAAPTPAKAAAKAGEKSAGGPGDDDVFGWLEEADQVDREHRQTDPSTRQFKVESDPKTETVDIAKPDATGSDTAIGKKDKKKEKKEKKEPGKLPPVPQKAMDSSQEAAADALRQFFKRS